MGVLGVVDALRLESTPSVCKNARQFFFCDDSDVHQHGCRGDKVVVVRGEVRRREARGWRNGGMD